MAEEKKSDKKKNNKGIIATMFASLAIVLIGVSTRLHQSNFQRILILSGLVLLVVSAGTLIWGVIKVKRT